MQKRKYYKPAERFFPFLLQEVFADTAVDMIPGQWPVEILSIERIKIRINALFFKGFLPEAVVELIAPAVKSTSFIIGGDKQAA